MKTVWRLLLATLLTLVLATGLVLATALQAQPLVAASPEASLDDIGRTIELLRQHDPRLHRPGALVAAWVAERDLQLLLAQATQRWLAGAGRLQIRRGSARLQLATALAAPPPLGRWLNVEIELGEAAGLPRLTALRVGHLPLPAWLARPALQWAATRAGLGSELMLAAELVQAVRFMPEQLHLSYRWQQDSFERLFGGLVTPADQQRLRAYAERLASLTAQPQAGRELPLPRLMQPLFELARSRSTAGGDAAAENRAALFVLALYVNGRTLDRLLPAAGPRPQPRRVLAAGRDDVPQHFLVSAALAAEAGGRLSKLVGLYKEVDDARHGSGFSFSDLAADRAGTRFGEWAVQSPHELQARFLASASEGDFLPLAADLVDALPEAEFRRRFGGVDQPGYEAVLTEIDRRVGALTIYR
ncbi:hypothetical protein [Rubrivivax sp. A210]|uniref:hypothetical protein n=1 Tax=Rubrivivax sp. A210 TaxID=2772301 RepID=UPI00191AEB17|nr:hypothetical protein [Rubrivivax sp. A210]